MKERFLPIGTVVMLKGGKKELMIINYCIIPTGMVFENKKQVPSTGKLYDYGACTYPEGVLGNNRILAFNHDQIEKIIHMGYISDQSEAISARLNEGYDKLKENIKNNDSNPQQ